MAPERWAGADGRIAAAERRADRPVSVVVGEDAPTIEEAAAAAAPANTTVVVPPGTYEETLTVNESVTIAGEDAQISGDGDGSVITVRAPDVALTGLAVDGSGGQTRDPEAAREGRADDGGVNGSDDGEVWDTNIQLGYGHGDAGIRAIGAPGLVVDDVTVEANASGLLLREGSHAVVRDLRVDGADSWQDGFMGIAGMGRVTVTDSAFEGGRDGIYLHRADGSVVRNSTFTDNRYGTHLMYTGDALIADNAFRNELFGGITVMTRPSATRSSATTCGTPARGCRRLVPGRTSGTQHARRQRTRLLDQLARVAVYERNVAANNELGARATTVVPSSRIVANDFVGNADHATAGGRARSGLGRRRPRELLGGANVGVPRPASERTARPPRSTLPSTARSRRGRRARVARGRPPRPTPGTVPGARSGSIIDPAPAAEPYSPDRIDAALDPDAGPVRADWRAELGDGSGESDEDAAMNAHDRNATSGGIGPRPQRSDRTTVPTVEGATASIRGVSDA